MRRLDQCPYRQVAGVGVGPRVAVCRFLQQFTGIADETACAVAADACESCCAWPEPSISRLNPVVASLLYTLADCSSDAASVRERAEAALAVEGHAAEEHIRYVAILPRAQSAAIAACDVVLCCTETTEVADRAIRSVLAQEDIAVFVHLVDDGGGGAELLARYASRPNVLLHRNTKRQGLFRTLHDRVAYLRSEFVAVQDAATTSRPTRLAGAVRMLVEYGADLLAAAVQTPEGAERPLPPGRSYRRAVAPETLVFRRAALVDMGGVADRKDDIDVELIHRAARERRSILLSDSVMVDCTDTRSRPEVSCPPVYSPREGTLRHHALGFPTVKVACDVVLPFYGQIDYVGEALASLLDQEGAEVIIHLIDDASPDGAGKPFLRRWSGHPRVRTYANLENIGPYSSFNNVVPYLETELVAVQDGDDISLPHRIHTAANALRLSGAEIFGGRTRPFGSDTSLRPSNTEPGAVMQVARPPYRGSKVPTPRSQGHIIEHPTAMYRIDAFERLGGYADFGRTDRNCCGLDTEFYLRAAHSGARFAVSNQLVLRYRCHLDSATQNVRTGWGSEPRTWTLHECRRRARLFQSGPFDPRAYGAMGRFEGVTRRFL